MEAKEWAKREAELFIEQEEGYGRMCIDSAYKAFLSLLEDRHSGASIYYTKYILNRLIENKPLTPIEDTIDIWNDVTFKGPNYTSYQCTRMSSLFKDVYDDGTVKYIDVDRFVWLDVRNPQEPGFHSSLFTNLLHDIYPITMPYYPEPEPTYVYMEYGLSDPENGDFDTVALRKVRKPSGEIEVLDMYFKEGTDGWIEIDAKEYHERVG